MSEIQRKNYAKPAQYKRITMEERLRLIKLIQNDGLTIKDAAKEMELSASTARVIYRTYESKGTIFESKAAKKERLEGPNARDVVDSTARSIQNSYYCYVFPMNFHVEPTFYLAISPPYQQPPTF